MTSIAPAVPPASFPATAPPPGGDVPARAPHVPSAPPTIGDVIAQRRHRVDGWSPVRVAAFLGALSETGSVTRSAEYAGMSTAACYTLRHHAGGAAFAEAWDNALSARFEILSEVAMTRIRNGTEKIRWWKGEKVGTDWVFSDRLLLAMIDRADPSRRSAGDAGPRRSAMSGAAGDLAASGAARRFDPVWDSSGEPGPPPRGLPAAALGGGGGGDRVCIGAGTGADGENEAGEGAEAGIDGDEAAGIYGDEAAAIAAADAAAFAEDHLRLLTDDERAAMAKPGTAFDDDVDYLDPEMRAAVDEHRAKFAARQAADAAMQAEIDARFAEFLGPDKKK